LEYYITMVDVEHDVYKNHKDHGVSDFCSRNKSGERPNLGVWERGGRITVTKTDALF